jgi:hypothetical protein
MNGDMNGSLGQWFRKSCGVADEWGMANIEGGRGQAREQEKCVESQGWILELMASLDFFTLNQQASVFYGYPGAALEVPPEVMFLST